MAEDPTPFEVHESGAYLHGTKAGHRANFDATWSAGYIYLTQTLDATTWGAEFAAGDEPGRIYVVESTGEIEDDQGPHRPELPGQPDPLLPLAPLSAERRRADGRHGHSPEKLAAT